MSRLTKVRPQAILILFIAAIGGSPLFGATVTKLSDDALAPLRSSMMAKKIHLDHLPIYDDQRSSIDLEEFQVWSPDAKVILHGDNGVVLEKLDPPPMHFFRGLVNGDLESFAFFSVDPTGRNIQGLVVTRDRRFSIASARRPGAGKRADDSTDVFLTTFDSADLATDATGTWQCEVDKMQIKTPAMPIHATGANGLTVAPQGITGTQSYAIKVDIETDFELFQNAGSDSAVLTTYITNLTGAVSTIYNRDLKTNVTQGNVNIYTTLSDPWNATNSFSGLEELGDYYHTNHGGPTASSVVFLSGKNIAGGVAWESVVCGNEFPSSGHFGGPYAWCGGIGHLFTSTLQLGPVPDPNAISNGTLYGMPSGTQVYWPLEEYAHELGHNLAGEHTQCVAISDAERIASGFTDGSAADSTSNFVDHCGAHDGTGCFGGAAGGTDTFLALKRSSRARS